MTRKTTAPKAVLFDWDNTLVDTWPIIHAALATAFAHMGQEPWTIEQVRARVHKSMRDAFPQVFGEKWEEAAEVYQTAFRAIHLERLRVLDGAEDMLKELRGMGLYMAVVSNKKGVNLRRECDHLAWNGYFDAIIGSTDATHDKPHAAPVVMALEGSGLKPGPDIWFIGDSVIDLECAKNTDLTAVLYGDNHTAEKDDCGWLCEGFRILAHVPDHSALRALFK